MMLTVVFFVAGVTVVFWLVHKIKINPRDRYVLITGCDTGFGNVLAKSLDREGCNVFATCLTAKGMEDLKKSTSGRLHAIMMDVTSSESVKAAYEEVKERLPRDSGLWGLVNNAGVAGNGGYYDWWPTEEFRRVVDVNLLGPIEVTNVFLPLVKKTKGRIVNMSSAIALLAFSSGGYEISKAGLEAFSDCLRHQMHNYSISVHIIEPVFFLTALTNPTVFNDKLETLWNRMTQERRDEYGRQCIDEFIRGKEKLSKIADPRLYLVTDAIEHALFARYPWKRYLVGGFASFIVRILGLLPAFIADFVVINILFPLPKPQWCK